MKGMTGFAEKHFTSGSLRLKVTIKSLNHRFFDWAYRGTPLGDVENRLRAICRTRFERGRLEVFVETNFLDPEIWNFSINEALLEKVLSSLERVALKLKKPFDLSLDQILKIPQIVDLSRKEMTAADTAFIERCFASTLDEVVKQRLREGRQTVRQLGLHIREIKRSVARIERLFKRQPARIREKLRHRLAELKHGATVSEERFAEETASLIQRFDLAEEILRLKSHLDTLGELIGPCSQGPVGKKLDFLAQEITREANTLSSKSQDIEMINEGLAIKNQMESIRQHVQNIE